jgi:hypothetical protein
MRQYLLYPAEVDVAYCILLIPLFAVEFNKYFFFQQSNVHTRLGGIDDQLNITCQNSGIVYIETEKQANSAIHLKGTADGHALQLQYMTIAEEMLSAFSSYDDSF